MRQKNQLVSQVERFCSPNMHRPAKKARMSALPVVGIHYAITLTVGVLSHPDPKPAQAKASDISSERMMAGAKGSKFA